jgi:HSP20 family protein
MSTLINVPKRGSLANTNSNLSFPAWSNWIDDLFNSDLPSVFSSTFNNGLTLPKVNIKETADAYFVEMAAPGLKKSDFHIDLKNESLSISTEIEEENETREEQYTRREYGYSSFKRIFSLPESVDDNKIKAKYIDGVLSIHLPKKEEAKQKPAKTIHIS